jgi:hypothetical protein
MAQSNPLSWIANRALSPERMGALDYFRYPERRDSWGGPFNGQPGRRALFDGIIKDCRAVAIVETGTYLGTTTEYLAGAGLPVFTVEGYRRNFGYSRTRLRRFPNVKVLLGDSRVVLKGLLETELAGRLNETLFFYLDAHWDQDLPLNEEIELIFTHTDQAVVMVDDFEVPGDPGYAYDNYGPGMALNADYIAGSLSRFGLTAYYPALASAQEGGIRRGCVTLAKDQVHGAVLRRVGFKA